MNLNEQDVQALTPVLTGPGWEKMEKYLHKHLECIRAQREGPVQDDAEPDLYLRGQIQAIKDMLALRKNLNIFRNAMQEAQERDRNAIKDSGGIAGY